MDGLTVNSSMQRALDTSTVRVEGLVSDLLGAANTEFKFDSDTVILTSVAPTMTNASLSQFPDRTGYEAWMNSLTIDRETVDNPLANALELADQILSRWNDLDNTETLVSVISYWESNAVVKFHMERQGESLLASPLEDFEEAILIVDSDSVDLLRKLIAN